MPSAPIKQPMLIAQPRLAESNGAVSAQHGVDFRSREAGDAIYIRISC